MSSAIFQKNRNIVSLLQLQHAKHGFTNPAQDYNKRNPDAFGYHPESANKAWRQTMSLLRRRLNITQP
jgi:dienelactone hydrolase